MSTVQANERGEIANPIQVLRQRRMLWGGLVAFFVISIVLSHVVHVEHHVMAKGYVISTKQGQLRPLVTAAVKRLNCRHGEQVQAGQVLIELDDARALAARELAAAELMALRKRPAATVVERRLAEARLKDAEAALAYYEVRAPHDGVVQLYGVAENAVVSSNDLLGEVLGPELRAQLRLREHVAHFVEAGQEVAFDLSYQQLETHVSGAVRSVGELVRVEDRVPYLEVICDFAPQEVPCGATCTARIHVGKRSLYDELFNR